MALHEVHLEQHAGFGGGGDHLPAPVDIRVHRLLDQHVNAPLDTCHDDVSMEVIGGGDGHGVRRCRVEQFVEVGEDVDAVFGGSSTA